MLAVLGEGIRAGYGLDPDIDVLLSRCRKIEQLSHLHFVSRRHCLYRIIAPVTSTKSSHLLWVPLGVMEKDRSSL